MKNIAGFGIPDHRYFNCIFFEPQFLRLNRHFAQFDVILLPLASVLDYCVGLFCEFYVNLMDLIRERLTSEGGAIRCGKLTPPTRISNRNSPGLEFFVSY